MSCTNPNLWYDKNYTYHSELNDAEFSEAFENARLGPKLFSHEAHLRLAWLYIQHHGEQIAIEKTCSGIKHFDIIYGNGDKFNATMTQAAVKVVHHFIQQSKSSDFVGFLEEFPRLRMAFKEVLNEYYGPDFLSKTNNTSN